MKCSSICVLLWLVLELSDAFLYGEVTGPYSWYQSFGLQSREQDTLEPYERIHQILD